MPLRHSLKSIQIGGRSSCASCLDLLDLNCFGEPAESSYHCECNGIWDFHDTLSLKIAKDLIENHGFMTYRRARESLGHYGRVYGSVPYRPCLFYYPEGCKEYKTVPGFNVYPGGWVPVSLGINYKSYFINYGTRGGHINNLELLGEDNVRMLIFKEVENYKAQIAEDNVLWLKR
jgi:hypothetical protein